MESLTDEQLMERFKAGDDAAFAPLFQRHSGPLYGFLIRMVRDPQLAQDLLQTTFLSMVRARGRYEPGTPFGSWILTIAANAARDSLRRQRRGDAAMSVVSRTESERNTQQAASDHGARKEIEEAFAQLPPQQREAVILHKLQGFSFEQISQTLGISMTAARIRAHRGYEKLRSLLGHLEEA